MTGCERELSASSMIYPRTARNLQQHLLSILEWPSPTCLLCPSHEHSSSTLLTEATTTIPFGEGLRELQETSDDQRLFAELQQLLTDTHKPYDNWTRDRGCRIHRRHLNKCSEDCVYKNVVPKGYVLRRAFRNHN